MLYKIKWLKTETIYYHHRRRRHPCLIHPHILFVCNWYKQQRLCEMVPCQVL